MASVQISDLPAASSITSSDIFVLNQSGTTKKVDAGFVIPDKGTAVASSATTNIWTGYEDFVHVTGTTTITSLGTAPYAGASRFVIFDGALTLTHNATTLVLPGSANITTEANDWMIVRADTTANMYIVSYTRASVVPLAYATQTQVDAMTSTTTSLNPNQNKIILATEQATTSGTSIDFTGIPSGVRRITIMFNGVSTNGTSNPLIQIGDSGGFETSGYLGSSAQIVNAGNPSTGLYTAGFGVSIGDAGSIMHGSFVLSLEDSTDFTWVASGVIGRSDAAQIIITGGSKSLSAVLTQVRITTVNGTDAFDAGAINITYER